MLKLESQLSKISLAGKRVILRTDLNVPRTAQGAIVNDFRLKEILPTINALQEAGGKIILLTHCGRPEKPSDQLSTKVFVEWFTQHNYTAVFAETIAHAMALSKEANQAIVIVENLRFFPGEKSQDEKFAHQLAQLGDYYVNDAFALMHRKDTSVTLLPKLFKPSERTIGLVVERELAILNQLMQNMQHPFVILQGGIKGETKLPLLKKLLKNTDAILISTPLCFSFLQAEKKPVGRSFTEPEIIPDIQAFLEEAKKKKVPVMTPIDYQVTTDSFEKPHSLKETKSLSTNDNGVSIGPETVALFASYLKKARLVFLNGIPGNIAYPETLEGSRILLNALQQTNALCVVAGGDTVALVQQLGFSSIGYLSTGGGATLAYLSGQTLPGLALFS